MVNPLHYYTQPLQVSKNIGNNSWNKSYPKGNAMNRWLVVWWILSVICFIIVLSPLRSGLLAGSVPRNSRRSTRQGRTIRIFVCIQDATHCRGIGFDCRRCRLQNDPWIQCLEWTWVSLYVVFLTFLEMEYDDFSKNYEFVQVNYEIRTYWLTVCLDLFLR